MRQPQRVMDEARSPELASDVRSSAREGVISPHTIAGAQLLRASCPGAPGHFTCLQARHAVCDFCDAVLLCP